MTAKTMSHKMTLAIVLLMVSFAGSACDRAGERLTAPRLPTISRSVSTVPQTYDWQFTVTNDSGVGLGCGVAWLWQFADGSTLLGGETPCGTSTGTGSIPSDATGIIVNGGLVDGYPAPCGTDSRTVTRSLNGAGNTSITINLSLSGSYKIPGYFGNNPTHINCPSVKAGFTLTFN